MSFKNICLYTILLLSLSAFAQVPPDQKLFRKFYELGKNDEIFVPLGQIAFADSVVSFSHGNPTAQPPFNKPENSLDEPDFTVFNTSQPKYVSLGCGGQLTVKFTDNGFIDIDGPDLVFFEVGPAIEGFRLEISTDGKKWYKLGNVNGGKSTVDIGKFIPKKEKKEVFYYIRITDLKQVCGGETPGADIDAIGAIGGVIKLSLDSKVLFDTDKFFLRETAIKALDKLERQLLEIPKARIEINGYTDSDGNANYNLILGKNRAISVRNYLKKRLAGKGDYTYQIKSFGESKPVRENTSDEGKQQNRRVEIIVFPSKDFYVPPKKQR